ncbi:MAG: PLP-dependent aminotransferase family protein [Clostridiales bacterium]|nr:PLP-dependent aminotransferase family protein [Clostridiales bacterium]
MLTYSFSDIGSESLYEYLYGCIKNDILSGKLRCGAKLPSKRTFAKNLGISTITIENAYALLISEGYVYSIPKKGYFVSDINISAQASPQRTEDENERREESFVADFAGNNTPHTLFPFATWAKLMRSVLSERQQELMIKSPGAGIAPLRSAIAEHLYQFRGMRVHPSQIIIGSGTEYLYGLIIQLLGSDKIFAVEDPGYNKIAKVYGANGVDYRYIPLDENGVAIEALRDSGAEILHISPSHHFPTGIVTPISRRYELLSWAAQSPKRFIIEDDYDSEFRLSGHPIPPLRSIDVTDKVIYMNTFSKSLASTIRISYMVLPRTLADKFYKALGFYSCTVSTFEQYTLAEFMNGGYFGNHINRIRRYYREERDELLKLIYSNKAFNGTEILEKDSGLHFLLRLDTELSDKALADSARRLGINISCLSEYYHNKSGAPEHTVVINYSGIEKEKIAGAVALLGKAIGGETERNEFC